MTDTLHSVARRMAAAGRLYWTTNANQPLQPSPFAGGLDASEAALAWAATQYAISRGWRIINNEAGKTKIATQFGYEQDGFSENIVTVDGTTALSVLLAVERACDAAEGASDAKA